MALAAVALAMEKPVGGAVELWLGCTSLGMPLWEASWWPKTALNCGSCCLGCSEHRRSRVGEDEDEGGVEVDAGAGGEPSPVRPPWGRAERAAVGCKAAGCVVQGGVEREVESRWPSIRVPYDEGSARERGRWFQGDRGGPGTPLSGTSKRSGDSAWKCPVWGEAMCSL